MSSTIRWGILGTGNIARQFAEGLKAANGAELRAVGSRTREAAECFGAKHGVPNRHATYEALAEDPEVDVIYIATPHPMHKDNSILCLRSGKAVLCEKPFTINRQEAEELVACARQENQFLMEAMWTRFLPLICKVREWIRDGLIGKPMMMRGDFGYYADYDADCRIFAPELAGGGLLDVGIYPISLAAMIFGPHPSRISATATLGKFGVDELSAVSLAWPEGGIAVTSSAIRVETPQDAVIMGDKGAIHIHSPFWRATKATLNIEGREPDTIEIPLQGNGYNYEAEAVMEALRAGKTESEIMPLEESIAIMDILDRARAQWGMKYPME